MRIRAKEQEAPVERYQTIRRRIMAFLAERRITAKEISEELRIPERDVYDHLEHIRKTTHRGESVLVVEPPVCEACAFIFRKRGRLKTPSKCPMCRSESIRQAVFSLEERHG